MMAAALFTVSLDLGDEHHSIEYHSIGELMEDTGMQALFDAGLVTGCIVTTRHGKRVAKLPLMEWRRLLDSIISSSTTLLRDGID